MRPGSAAAFLIALMLAINLVIWTTGNMHAHRHHPAWVDALSWLFVAAGFALVAVAVVALRRQLHRRTD